MKRSILLASFFLLISCGGNDNYFPKPRLYPRVAFPVKSYQSFEETFCDLAFSYPTYARVVQDKYFFDGKPLDPCWFDLEFDTLNATLHCSYLPVENRAHFDKLIGDSFSLVNEHNKKAEYREDQQVLNKNGVGGLLFEVDGPVATPLQFFLTDTTDHFLRGSLYFNAKVDPDSIAPVYAFVKEDIYEMLASFRWDTE